MASSSRSRSTDDPEIQALDDLYAYAGLVRNMRGKAGGVTVRMRMERAEPEDLRPPAPESLTAKNGVQWIPLPWSVGKGSAKFDWLMGGFSTRMGGLSTAYCAEGAPGELNLGFTASDDRKIVEKNRKLFVQAVSGRITTPLITLRQIHSALVWKAARKDARLAEPHKGDALIINEPGVLIGIQTADCIPVLVADRKRRVVAAFHAAPRWPAFAPANTGTGHPLRPRSNKIRSLSLHDR